MAERGTLAARGRGGITLPVQGCAGFTQDPARPASADYLLHGREMIADYLVQLSPESALFEISSNSANAFPAISRAVFVFPSSLASFSFRASSLAESSRSFLFSARSRASSPDPASLAGLPAEEAGVPFSCC